jgi:hypothetical protein
MPSRENSERLVGSAFLGVPAFDAFVWLLDNYGRWDLLVNLHDHLPRFLTSPMVTFGCTCIGLWLLHLSHQEQLRRAYEQKNERRLVDTSGTEIINRERSRILIPVLVAFLIALLITPLAAIGFSLAYKGNQPKYPVTPHPPLIAYEKPQEVAKERQKSQQQSGNDSIQTGPITTAPCSSVQVGSDNTATVTCVPPDRLLSDDSLQKFKDMLDSAASKGAVDIIKASTSTDVERIQIQLVYVLHNSHWGLRTRDKMIVNNVEPTASGIECYSQNWSEGSNLFFHDAATFVHFPCKYIDHLYDGGTFVKGSTIQILIGDNAGN